MRRSYPALTFLIMASKALGIAVAVCGTLGGLLVLSGGLALGSAFGLISVGFAVALIPGSLAAGLGLVAAGEWIELHITIETNTRPGDADELADVELRWVA